MKNIIYFIVTLISFTSCRKDKDEVYTNLGIVIKHKVGIEYLKFNMYNYTNAAGNNYEVTNLLYYLSNFVFHNSDGTDFSYPGIFYISADEPNTSTIHFSVLPSGNYSSLSFKLGLPPDQNISYKLPNITENNNMAWPELMGGGYHFLRFEGRYINKDNQIKGFAIHTGTNVSLVNIHLPKPFEVKGKTSTLNMSMNINEWFANPVTLNLDSLSYTMGNASGMALIAANGTDVFSME